MLTSDRKTALTYHTTTTATIPNIRGTSETIARILRPNNIRVAHKPIFTLQRLLTNVKGKDKREDRPGAVYKIKCSDCQHLCPEVHFWTYFTARPLISMRPAET